MEQSAVTIDILSNPRYQGAIQSIRGLTDWVDAGFGMVITFVAFMIILVALLKNVLAGAYVAFPKFWDKVDLAHQEKQSQNLGWIQAFQQTFTGSAVQSINMGTFSKALLGIMPNIKTLTEFEDDTVRPRDYFMRAIPQMLAVIIIGAFIYNGYYRDVAAKVTDFGSEIVSRVLLEVDPIALYDQFTNTVGRPSFSTDNAATDYHKFINQVAVKCYSTIIGTYTDVDSVEAKSALANQVETWVINSISNNADCNACVDDPEWKPKVNVSLVLGAPELSKIEGTSSDGLVKQFAFATSTSTFGISSTKEQDKDWHLRVIIQFEKQAAEKGTVSLLTDVVLHMPTLTDSTYVAGKGYLSASGGTATVDLGGGATATLTVSSTGSITVTGGGASTGEYPVSGLSWVMGSKTHTITTIKLGSTSIELSSPSLTESPFSIADGPSSWEKVVDSEIETEEPIEEEDAEPTT